MLKMFLKFIIKFLIILNCLISLKSANNCSRIVKRKFYLWKTFQRSLTQRSFVDNVNTLKDCEKLALKYKGLALNYAPSYRLQRKYEDRKENRDHFWNQPQLYFNCHILQCPENKTFRTLINDTSFDYYTIYDKPLDSTDYICLPEIGLFVLHSMPETYDNASRNCRQYHNKSGSLAHVASQKRTEALTRLIQNYNEDHIMKLKSKIYLAYIGLHYNATWTKGADFFNSEMENLKCFNYRAWEAGNPKMSMEFGNSSCVALTENRSWRSVQCNRKLPYICEILTSCDEEM
ncbi:uncharacterized protein ACRADG_011305 [Cochliomyia hominivorax]